MDVSADQRDDAFHERQPKTKAGGAAIVSHPVKRVEYLVQLVFRYPRALILHIEKEKLLF